MEVSSGVLFTSIITDITGRLPLSSDDPRWSQLLRCPSLLLDMLTHPSCIRGNFTTRMIENNLSTKNFLLLLEQVIHRLHQINSRKVHIDGNSYSSEVIQEACTGLFLVSLILQDFIAILSKEEVFSTFILRLFL